MTALRTMRSLLLCGIGQLEIRDVPRPEPRQHDVLVRVSAVGLCGTDFHIFSGQTNYNRDKQGKPIPLVEQPQIMGHEIVGVVEEVGHEVRDLRIGDRVVLDQGLNCVSCSRKPLCEYCASNDSHQCHDHQASDYIKGVVVLEPQGINPGDNSHRTASSRLVSAAADLGTIVNKPRTDPNQ